MQYSKSEPFDAWIPYLAANIFNLYVCREKVDHENERTIDFIALSCLSIAWKSREKDFSIRMLKYNARVALEKNQFITEYSKSESFDAWIPYLAANIFNLYVCREKVDHENERTIDLLALSCLSIAWKSREKDFSIRMLKYNARVALEKNQFITEYSKSEPFDAWIPYLAANIFNLYVDHENERTIDLIALSCLSIAWKSREKDFSIHMLKWE
ncbi:hypothetical protein G4B88_002533 [Cannabis sativa]|uniref:B-like cyclin n=1 Tax=Cannabis sativa TaxID=3483 RepID=A0A7J6IAI6_CANSA|nr:hypothetical protein G4B88_002533 [Cannabis sativa]